MNFQRCQEETLNSLLMRCSGLQVLQGLKTNIFSNFSAHLSKWQIGLSFLLDFEFSSKIVGFLIGIVLGGSSNFKEFLRWERCVKYTLIRG